MTLGTVDVLVLTVLKDELDALLKVRASEREPWTVEDGAPPLHVVVLEGRAGPIRLAAARLTGMGGVATAALATQLIDAVKPACVAMCGVCAGHPADTEIGDVVIAERLFQHDKDKFSRDGFQGGLLVDALRDDWLRVAQDLVGPATGIDLYTAPGGDTWKWWFLDCLAEGRDPLTSAGLRRYIPDERRSEYLAALLAERLVTLKGATFTLTEAGRTKIEEHQVMRKAAVTAHPFHIRVGPMGSVDAVEAGGRVWKRLADGGMRRVLAVEMEAAAIGRVAHERGLRFAVAKGVMDHADPHKTDRFKAFAAQAAAEVLCAFLSKVVVRAAPATTPLSRSPAAIEQTANVAAADQGRTGFLGVPFESVRGVTRSALVEQVYLRVWFPKFKPRAPRFFVDMPIEMCVALGPQIHFGSADPPLSEDLLRRLRQLSQIDVWVQCADADVTPCDGTLHLPWPTNVLSFELTPRRPGGLRIVIVLLIHNQPVHRLEREVQVYDRRERGERWS